MGGPLSISNSYLTIRLGCVRVGFMTVKEFVQDVCMCGSKREPTRRLVGGLSLLVCGGCKKATRAHTPSAYGAGDSKKGEWK